ncbi:MAG TPA: hypothetical protein PK333_04385, partial [Candidatus Moranbacteria bacterium]|nr:hypothetical protein [Candidatus Moranbacteria bacterium]
HRSKFRRKHRKSARRIKTQLQQVDSFLSDAVLSDNRAMSCDHSDYYQGNQFNKMGIISIIRFDCSCVYYHFCGLSNRVSHKYDKSMMKV